MYEPGDAEFYDTRGGTHFYVEGPNHYELDPGKYVILPHTCRKWVIGKRTNVEQMIADLTKLLEDPRLL